MEAEDLPIFWVETTLGVSYYDWDIPEGTYTEFTWNAVAEDLREWAESFPEGTHFRAVVVVVNDNGEKEKE